MNEPVPFLAPRLVGERFKSHTVPLELLKDFVVLEEMIVEVAKWHYLEDHPERSRLTRGFVDTVKIHLAEVTDGSAIVKLVVFIAATGSSVPTEVQVCFDRARDNIVGVIDAAERDDFSACPFPRKFLSFFDRMGRGLRDGESIEFAPDKPQKARLTKETRRKLVLHSESEQVSEEVCLRGSVPKMDQQDETFQLQLSDGRKIQAPIQESIRDVILDAFVGYREGKRVLLRGIGTFSRTNKLTRIEEIVHIGPLDPNDIEWRIDELRGLRNG